MNLFSKIAIILFYSTSSLLGQQFSFRNYTVEEGLIQSQVINMVQDPASYLWFATRGGVSKFDGLSFENFTEEDGLIDNRCTSIILDSEENVWIGTQGGVTRISSFVLNESAIWNGLPGEQIYSICEFENTIWCSGENGLFIIDKDEITLYNKSNGLTDNTIRFSLVHNKKMLIATDKGISVYENGVFKPYPLNNTIDNLQINHLLYDTKNRLWISTINGLFLKTEDKIEKFTSRNGLSYNVVNRVLEDSDGEIWIGTDDGISKYQKNGFQRYDERDGLSLSRITSILEDEEGNIWFSTYGGGVNKYEQSLFENISTKDGLPNNLVWAVNEFPKGTMWFGTEKGLSRLKNNTYKNYDIIDGLSDNRIGVIYPEENGIIWIGTDRGGFCKFDGNNFTSYETKDGLVHNAVYAIKRDLDKFLWIGTREGLSKFDGKNFANFTKEDGLLNDRVNSIHVDVNGRIWIGTDSGLNYFENNIIHDFHKEFDFDYYSVMSITQDAKKNIWFDTYDSGIVRFNPTKPKDEAVTFIPSNSGLEDSEIYFIQFDAVGNLWVGTNRGVSKFDVKLFDETGEVKFSNYGKAEGFLGIECNQNAAFLDSEKNIWFGTIYGANKYNSLVERHNSSSPNTHIKRIRLYFEEVSWKDYDEEIVFENGLPTTLNLPYDQNHITFDYIGISLGLPEKVTYKCMLDGFDKDWTPVSTDNSITYANLPHGDYTFKLLAANSYGEWNEEPVTFNFSIKPPFWLTTTFILFSILIIVLSIYTFIKVRTTKLKEQGQILERLVNERSNQLVEKAKELQIVNNKLTELNIHLRESEDSLKKLNASKDKFFSIIAHDLKSPFNSLLGFSKLLTENLSDYTREEISESIQSVNNSAKKVYNLLENLLTWSRIQIGGMSFYPENVDFKKLVEETIGLLEDVAKNKNITIIDLVKENTLVHIDKNMIETVLRNIIVNAIKFSNLGGEISVGAKEDNGMIDICIEDNGVGIDDEDITKLFRIDINHTTEGTQNERGTGVGLILCKELVEKNNGQIWVESEPGIGSKFIFSVKKSETIPELN